MTRKEVNYPTVGNNNYLSSSNHLSMVESAGRLFNAAINLISWIISVAAREAVAFGMPFSIGVELTNHCNLCCAECFSGSGLMKRDKGFMQYSTFNKIITELRPYLLNVNLYFQGESMLHPDFFRFVEICKGLKLTLSTNGYYLSEENAARLAGSGIKKLIVSLDGMDQESYSNYRRGGKAEIVIRGIKNLAAAIRESGSSMKLEIQMLVNKQNESQVSAVNAFAIQNNAKLRLKSMQILDYDHIDDWLPEDKNFRRYKNTHGRYTIKSRLRNHCLRLWINPVVTWDGKVIPCCFDKDADHILGDINLSSFRQIWNGGLYRTFRRSVLTKRKETGICCNCTTGLMEAVY